MCPATLQLELSVAVPADDPAPVTVKFAGGARSADPSAVVALSLWRVAVIVAVAPPATMLGGPGEMTSEYEPVPAASAEATAPSMMSTANSALRMAKV